MQYGQPSAVVSLRILNQPGRDVLNPGRTQRGLPAHSKAGFQAGFAFQCSAKRLVLVGSISPEVEKMIESSRQDSRISVMGHVPQQQIKKRDL